MKNFFVILGGMGTLATTGFLDEMNRKFRPEKDQEYLNYLLFNHADIPDRTEYILGKSKKNPQDYLIEDIKQAESMDPDFYVMACNTAHYFYDDLIKITNKPFINMPDLVLSELNKLDKGSPVGIFATEGSIKSGLYNRIIKKSGCKEIDHGKLQDKVNKLIYDDIKAGGDQSLEHYKAILQDFINLGAKKIILGCTELSYMNSLDDEKKFPVVDAEELLLIETINMARKMQNK